MFWHRMAMCLVTAITHGFLANFPVNKWDTVYMVDLGYFSH